MFLSKRISVLLSMLIVLFASTVSRGQAGTNGTGIIAGVVKDSTGAAMPGVVIKAESPALIEGHRDVTTGSDGLYAIVNLPPGAYTISFRSPGFSTTERQGVDVSTGFTASVNIVMAPGSVEQTVTVTGAAPVLDLQDSVVQKTISKEVLEALPVGQSASTYTALVPGAVAAAGNQDVGGIKGEQYQGFRVHGSAAGDFQQLRDGMFWGTLVAAGNYMSSANPTSIQETQIETSGYAAEDLTSGGHVNLVPRSGGNSIHGSFESNYGNSSLQATNISAAIKSLGVPSPPTLRALYEIAGGVGGPFIKNKLWYFVDGRHWTSSATNAGTTAFFNSNVLLASPKNLYYHADSDNPSYSNDYYSDVGLRLTWQPTARNTFTGNVIGEKNCNCYFNIAAGTTSPEATGNDYYAPNWRAQSTWQFLASNKLLLWAGATAVVGAVDRQTTGSTPANVSVTDSTANFIYGAAGTGVGFTTSYGTMKFLNINENFTASYTTGAHSFKVGYQELQGRGARYAAFNNNGISYLFSCQNIAGLPAAELANDVPIATNPAINSLQCANSSQALLPNQIVQFLNPYSYLEAIESRAIFGQDQWRIKRLTVNLGLRLDWFTSSEPAQGFAANPQYGLAARSFAAQSDVLDWKDLNPRIGFVYDVFGNGKTAVKASLVRAVLFDPLGGYTSLSNPAQQLANTTSRTWRDINGTFNPYTGGGSTTTAAANGGATCAAVPTTCVLGPVSNSLFYSASPTPTYSISNDVTHGWMNRAYNWQMSASIEHEIRNGLAVTFGFYHTWYGNLAVARNTLIPTSGYDEYCVTPPANAAYGVGGKPICNLYDPAPAYTGKATFLVQKASDFSCSNSKGAPGCGNETDVYTGLDVLTNIRVKGVFLQGGLTAGHEVTNYCVEVNSPQDLTYSSNPSPLGSSVIEYVNNNFGTANDSAPCHIVPPWYQNLQFKLAGVYTLRWGHLQFSANEQNLPSIPLQASYSYSGSSAAGIVAFSSDPALNPNGQTTLTGNPATTYKTEVITPQTQFPFGRSNQLDFRVSRRFVVERFKIEPTADFFNIFNANTILGISTGYNANSPGAAGAWRNVSAVLPGRLVKFGVHLDF